MAGYRYGVDSPLAANFNGLYRQLKPFWNLEAQALLHQGRHPLAFIKMTVVDSHPDHLQAVQFLARSHQPYIVLAGSGMCTGRQVVNYLKALLPDARNYVLVVGYQAEGTPGRGILDYGPAFVPASAHLGTRAEQAQPEISISSSPWVELDGQRYPIRAKVHQVSGYSAHAGQTDLLAFATAIRPHLKQIRLVHGEAQAITIVKLLSNHSRTTAEPNNNRTTVVNFHLPLLISLTCYD